MTSPTDTNQASELLELCKKVYEKTGWTVGDESWYWHTTTDAKLDSMFIAPKYYTDYLLEKLPDGTTIMKDVQGFKAWNVYNRKRIATYTCDSPVEALLKLTLKLHEEKKL